MAPNGDEAAASYLNYREVLSDLLQNNDVVSACNEVRHRLSASGYFHEISDMRAVELVLFISPSDPLLKLRCAPAKVQLRFCPVKFPTAVRQR
jgi:hypothetical protein